MEHQERSGNYWEHAGDCWRDVVWMYNVVQGWNARERERVWSYDEHDEHDT